MGKLSVPLVMRLKYLTFSEIGQNLHLREDFASCTSHHKLRCQIPSMIFPTTTGNSG